MPIAKMPQRNYVPQYPLRTLVWLTVLGPPFLALAWWGLRWAWPLLSSLENFGRMMLLPGTLLVLVLISLSVFYYPVESATRVKPPLRQVGLLWCLEFVTLWHWLNFMALLFGWLLIWGDRHGPPETEIAIGAAVLAAAVAALTSKRLTSDSATVGYLTAVVALTAILLILATPLWLGRLLRL